MSKALPPASVDVVREGDTLTITLGGDWRITARHPVWAQGASKLSSAKCVVLRGEKVGTWDSSLALYVRAAKIWAESHGAEWRPEGLPTGVIKLADLLAQKPSTLVKPAGRPDFFSVVGLATLKFWQETKDLAQLVGECAYSVARFFRGKAQFRWRDCFAEMQQCGVMALPIVGLINFLVGVTLAYIGSLVVRQYGGDIFIADMVGLAVVREMGPMMTAIVLAGRTGAAYAATLANMKANEEIDALSTLGVSSIDFLVMPRVVALFCMMPLLALYANGMGVLGGMAVGALPPLNIPANLFWAEMQTAVDLSDINTGIIKAATFGLFIGLAGCWRGLQADRSAAGVGVAATRSVVTAIFLIIVADSLYAVVFNILGW